METIAYRDEIRRPAKGPFNRPGMQYERKRMLRVIAISAVSFAFLLFPLPSYCITVHDVQEAHGAEGASVAGARTRVVNIVLESIDAEFVYAKDGRSFPIDPGTKIIDNRHAATDLRTAELLFQGDSLISISIK